MQDSTKPKDILLSPWFLIALTILVLNDHFFKNAFHNVLTGKLSDFAGLFIFPLFWWALFPKYRVRIFVFSALGFIWWKTPYADVFINAWNQLGLYAIERVVDYTDYIALISIPLAYQYSFVYKKRIRLPAQMRYLILVLSLFAFVATSPQRIDYSLSQDRGGGVFCDPFDEYCKKKVKINRLTKWHLSDRQGVLVGDSVYFDEINRFSRYKYTLPSDSIFFTVKQNQFYGLIDTRGKEILPAKFESISQSGRGFFEAKENGLITIFDYQLQVQGTIDSLKKKVILNPDFIVYSNVNHKDSTIFVDSTGNKLTPFFYIENHIPFKTELNSFIQLTHPGQYNSKQDYYILIGSEGILVEYISKEKAYLFRSLNYESVYFENGFKTMKTWKDKGANYYFDELIPDFEVESNRIIVKKNGLWGILDRKGRWILKPKHKRIMPYSEGLAVYQSAKTDKFGYLNLDGKIALYPKFNYAADFSFGMAPVQVETSENGNKKFVYINKNGELVLEQEFDVAYPFNMDSLAVVGKADMHKFLLKWDGKAITEWH